MPNETAAVRTITIPDFIDYERKPNLFHSHNELRIHSPFQETTPHGARASMPTLWPNIERT